MTLPEPNYFEFMTNWTRDLRYAARALRKAPTFAAVSIGMFGVAIAAATAVFSLVSSVYLRPLPFTKPGALVLIQQESPTPDCAEACPVVTTLRSLRAWSANAAPIAEIAIGRIATQVGISAPSTSLLPRGAAVSVNFFQTLGVHAEIGRTFSATDLDENTPDVIILSHSLWSSAFAADSAVIGTTTDLGGRPFRVIGVMPTRAEIGAPLFEADGPSIAYYIPLGRSEPDEADVLDGYTIVGRLRSSNSGNQLRARADQLLAMSGDGGGTRVGVAPKRQSVLATVLPLATAYAKPFARIYAVFLGGVLFLALVTSANLAGLFAVRLASRHGEVAIRMALGATRIGLARQFTVEGMVIGSLGGALGLGLGRIGVGFIQILPTSVVPYWTTIQFDQHVVVLGVLCSVILGVLFALGPAIALSGSPAVPRTHEIAGATSSTGIVSINHALVAFEIACTLTLLTGAGLFTKTFVSIARRDPGIAQHSLVVGELYARHLGFDGPDQQRALAHRVLDQLSSLPGVATVGILGRAEGSPIIDITLARAGAAAMPSDAIPRYVISASPDYFRASGVALIAGREFVAADRSSAAPVAILDEVAAERLFGRSSPIGQRMKLGSASSALPWVQVVGIVRTVSGTRLAPAHQPRPTIYVPLDQAPTLGLSFAVRTRGSSAQALPTIREALHTAAPNVPVAVLSTIEGRLSEEIAPARTNLAVVGLFACVALILASLAVYGTVSHAVIQRRGEFAIRLALGARAQDITNLALRRVTAVTSVGLAIGVASSLALVRFLRALLYGISPTDVPVFTGAMLLVVAVSLAAALLGARRIGRIDPALTLR